MSAIASTASITLITGVPGNGKTLRAVWYMQQAVKAGETVFACNINGVAIEGVETWDDPTEWEKLAPGSILVVDEAQRFFRAAAGAAPAYIQAMETIRHVGVRLILLTQSPALIHPNIRALVGLHEHLVRQGGKQLATVYRRSRVMDNVRSEKALLAEDHESWAFPRECYDLYKSAEVHTVKHTLSSKAKRGIVLGTVAALLVGYAVWNGKRLFAGGETEESGAATTAASAVVGAAVLSPNEQQPRYADTRDYARQHLPRIGTMPWTAPVFDERPTTSDPQLICMSSMEGIDGQGNRQEASCTCLTEQGTRYDLSQPECRTIARHGPVYNPYKRQQDAFIANQQQPQPQGLQSQPVANDPIPVDTLIQVQPRPMGTFPESAQNRYSGS